jgi:mRNA interferase HigB
LALTSTLIIRICSLPHNRPVPKFQKKINVPNLVTISYIRTYMRVIAIKTLRESWKEFPLAKQALLSWYEEAEAAVWENPNQLKEEFRNASIITKKRVVFNIHGNSFRLIVDIEYRLKIIFVVWFGTHKQYDNIDVKKVSYAKTNKK